MTFAVTGAWIGASLGIIILFVFPFQGTVKENLWTALIISHSALGLISVYLIGELLLLVTVGPVLLFIGFANIRWLHFCRTCGQSYFMVEFHKTSSQKICPACNGIIG
ncbi:MAG: hypothetical protein ABUK01_01810 [Leptospirales bacterium]